MRTLESQLDAWLAAGVISPDTAGRIRTHEAASSGIPAAQLAAEALGYVGAALAVAAVWLLTFELWRTLADVAQVVALGIVAVALAAGAFAVGGRGSGPLDRLQGVLAAASLSVAAAAAWLLGVEVLGRSEDAVGTAIGAGLVVGVLAVVRSVPRLALQLAGLVGAAMLIGGATELVGSRSGTAETVAWAVGLLVYAVAPRGWFGPTRTAELCAAVYSLGAVQMLVWNVDTLPAAAVGMVTAAGLVAAGLRRGRGTGTGALGLLVFAPQVTFAVFGDRLAGPALLGVLGLVVLTVAVGLTRVRSATSPE